MNPGLSYRETAVAGASPLRLVILMYEQAIQDLRRWQLWDLTDDVLAQHGKKSHDAPLMRRAIIRYAMCCPKPRAADFVAQRRRDDPEAVRDVEEGLQQEKTK